ncbi:hypothetical protein [Cryobacterium sp. TMT2-15-1]|uniref:hypothetical protein n=1 Tax=Cryobacterium sp. TMT2-15-1 TaxID=1259246 RepID=UPI00106BF599|nr:hypothetical protein [Cryobacterium sp. TMT2-15-1]
MYVRWGKSTAGSSFKPSNDLTVFDWSAEVMDDWIHNGFARFGEPVSDLNPDRPGDLVTEPLL